MNIFEKATRMKVRFTSIKGPLTVEQLWDLPLTATNGFCLDSVARSTNNELKEVSEESFVSTSSSPMKELCELKLQVVKHIIEVRLSENKAASEAADKQRQRSELVEALHMARQKDIQGLSAEEIQKRIDALG